MTPDAAFFSDKENPAREIPYENKYAARSRKRTTARGRETIYSTVRTTNYFSRAARVRASEAGIQAAIQGYPCLLKPSHSQ